MFMNNSGEKSQVADIKRAVVAQLKENATSFAGQLQEHKDGDSVAQ